MEGKLKIFCLNSRGTVGKSGHIINLLLRYDIVCLQEQRFGENQKIIQDRINQLQKLTNSKVFFTKIKDKNLGVAILVRNSHVEFIQNYKILIEGRVQLLEIKNKDSNYNLINVYGPALTIRRLSFYREL